MLWGVRMEAGRGRVLRSIAVGALLGAVVACVVLLGGDASLPEKTGLLEAAIRHGAAAVGEFFCASHLGICARERIGRAILHHRGLISRLTQLLVNGF